MQITNVTFPVPYNRHLAPNGYWCLRSHSNDMNRITDDVRGEFFDKSSRSYFEQYVSGPEFDHDPLQTSDRQSEQRPFIHLKISQTNIHFIIPSSLLLGVPFSREIYRVQVYCFLPSGRRTRKEHIKSGSTTIIPPALSNSPQ